MSSILEKVAQMGLFDDMQKVTDAQKAANAAKKTETAVADASALAGKVGLRKGAIIGGLGTAALLAGGIGLNKLKEKHQANQEMQNILAMQNMQTMPSEYYKAASLADRAEYTFAKLAKIDLTMAKNFANKVLDGAKNVGTRTKELVMGSKLPEGMGGQFKTKMKEIYKTEGGMKAKKDAFMNEFVNNADFREAVKSYSTRAGLGAGATVGAGVAAKKFFGGKDE